MKKKLMLTLALIVVLILLCSLSANADYWPTDPNDPDRVLTSDVEINGDLYITGGTIDLNGHTLTVHGDLEQSKGTIFVNCGTLNVDGHYYLVGGYQRMSDGTMYNITSGSGALKMINPLDEVNVGGDFQIYSNNGMSFDNLTAGTLRIGGNFLEHCPYDGVNSQYYGGFKCKDSHTVVFNGIGRQHISFHDASVFWFNNVVFENDDIQFDSEIKGFAINEPIHLTIGVSDFSVDSTNGVKGTLDLSNCASVTLPDNFTFSGGTLILGVEEVTVANDMYITGGTLDLCGSTLNVGGNLEQGGGTLYVDCGTVNVGGHLWIIGSYETHPDGSMTFYYGNGHMKMTHPSDEVNVAGSFRIYSDWGTYTAGTLRIGGDFRENCSYDGVNAQRYGGFNCSGTHTVVFNGTGTQHISCKYTGYGFANVVFENTDIQIDSDIRGFTVNDPIDLVIGTPDLTVNGTLDLSACASVTLPDTFTLSGGTMILGLAEGTTADRLYLAGGTLDLCGSTLNVTGDLEQSGGTMDLNRGTLNVGGHYWLCGSYTTLDDGTVTEIYRSTGKLQMVYPEDEVNVAGSFWTFSNVAHGDYLTAGTLRLGGDFYEYDFAGNNFACSGTHTVVFSGVGTQNIKFRNTSSSGFANVVFENPDIQLDSAVKGFTINDPIRLTIGTSDFSVNGTLDLSPCASVTLPDDFTFSGSGTLKLGQEKLTVANNLYLKSGVLDLNGSTLNVGGDVEQSGGTMKVNCGTLNVGGHYWLIGSYSFAGDGTLTGIGKSSGHLQMTNAADEVNVAGEFRTYAPSHSDYLTAGTLRIGGDFYQSNSNHSASFACSGTHTVVFNGSGMQHIKFSDTSSGFANAVFENPDIQLDNAVKGFTINDPIRLTIGVSDFSVNGTLNLSHCASVTLPDDFTFSGSGTLKLGPEEITVANNLKLTGSGVLDLNGSTLNVGGNVEQSGGTMKINAGTLNVGGHYWLIGSYSFAGDGTLTGVGTSSGHLQMTNAADEVNVAGEFRTYASVTHKDYLTAGALRVGGDFYASSNQSYNFACSGTHTVILTGTEPQSVTIAGTYSHFNKLVLTQPLTNYTFSPDNCWTTLVEADAEKPPIEVTSVTLSARTLTLTAGKSATLTSAVLPLDATDKTLLWSSSDMTVATVDQNGNITAVGEGAAVIRAEASNGLYRTCTVTVHEIYSGVFAVGDVRSLPGEEVAVPIVAWDNPGFAAMRVTLDYDASKLTFAEVRSGLLSGENLTYEDHTGSVNVLWYGSSDMAQDGTLFYAVFRVSSSAKLNTETALSLRSRFGDICKADHSNLSFASESGTVRIRQAIPGDIYEDDEVNVHDILVLQRYLTGLETLSSGQMSAADLTGDGSVDMRDIVVLAQQLVSEVNLMGLMGSGSDALRITVADAVVGADGYVDVPVVFSGSMAAFRLNVNYDESLLELVSVDGAQAVRDNLCDNLSDPARTQTLITWYSASDEALNGTVFTLRFRLLDADFAGLIPVSVEAAENDLCTASLMSLTAAPEYGVIHADYRDDLQAANVSLTGGSLSGAIVCDRALNGTAGVLVAACYDADGRMLRTELQSVMLMNGGTFELTVDTACAEAKLFVLSGGSWAALNDAAVLAD